MAELPTDVERIVREVLAEMGLGPAAAARENGSPRAQEGTGRQAASGSRADGDLVVNRRVVTLADLPERLENVRRVIVPPRAVITPSVRDVLRRHRVSLVAATAETVKTDGRVRVVLVAKGSSYDPAALVKMLSEEGFAIESRKLDCLIGATDFISEELREGPAVGLLLTRHAAAAVCLANRLPRVRAVRGTSAKAVAADADAVGANVLVIDPAAQGVYPTQQMVRQFVRGAPRECPEALKQRLE